MSTRSTSIILIVLLILTISVWFGGCGKDDPVSSGPRPVITYITVDPGDIVIGDSSLITYKAHDVTSMTLYPDEIPLAEVDSGQVYVKPSHSTEYMLLARSQYGRDSAKFIIMVDTTPSPVVLQFTAEPYDIVPGESVVLSYRTRFPDSLKLFPDGIRLEPPDSGSMTVEPEHPTNYKLVVYNEWGIDSSGLTVSMSTVVPDISVFTLSEDTILVGDSSSLIWEAQQAYDSIVVDNGVGRLPDNVSGQIVVKLDSTTTYQAIAFNDIGTDTAQVTLRVEIPYTVEATNGLYYRGTEGNTSQLPLMRFRARDAEGEPLILPWMHFEVAEGSGILSVDSAIVDGTGEATVVYEFTGGIYAVVRAMLRDIDTVNVRIRADTIILPGPGGQAQCVRLNDTYADVKNYNGNPLSVDIYTGWHFLYANYENTLGVVAIIHDSNADYQAANDEPVSGVILTSNFVGGSTPEGIGIGSPIENIRQAYGSPDTAYYDPREPVAWAMEYQSLGLYFFCGVSGDSAVFELHVIEDVRTSSGSAPVVDNPPSRSGYSPPLRWRPRYSTR